MMSIQRIHSIFPLFPLRLHKIEINPSGPKGPNNFEYLVLKLHTLNYGISVCGILGLGIQN